MSREILGEVMQQDQQAEAQATTELGYRAKANQIEAALKWGFVAGLISIPAGAIIGVPDVTEGNPPQFHSIVTVVAALAGYARAATQNRKWYRRVAELSRR